MHFLHAHEGMKVAVAGRQVTPLKRHYDNVNRWRGWQGQGWDVSMM
jgi:hypothetical protein